MPSISRRGPRLSWRTLALAALLFVPLPPSAVDAVEPVSGASSWAELSPSESFSKTTIDRLVALDPPVTTDLLTSTTLELNTRRFDMPELQFAFADYLKSMPASDSRTTATRLNFRLNLALTHLAAQLAEQEGALNDADFKRQAEYLHSRHAAEYYIRQRVLSGITVSEADITEYYEKATSEFTKPEMVTFQLIFTTNLDDARTALTAINGGTLFEAVAEKYSEHVSRLRGGRLGPIARGSLDESLEAAIFALADGEMSGLIETPKGAYIVKRLSTQPAKVTSLAEARSDIYNRLSLERRRQALDQFYSDLLDNRAVDLLSPMGDAAPKAGAPSQKAAAKPVAAPQATPTSTPTPTPQPPPGAPLPATQTPATQTPATQTPAPAIDTAPASDDASAPPS